MKRVSLNQIFITFACRNNCFKTCKIVDIKIGNRFTSFLSYALIVLLVFLSSCGQMGKTGTNETPTRGKIRITVDESFQPIIESEVFTFTHLYENAFITPVYKPEYDVINDFMNDSVKVIVTSKKLTDSQIQYLRDTLIVARTSTYAYDALALVTNKQNMDTLLSFDAVKDIFTGKAKSWKDIDKRSKLGNIRVIFDNNRSGNIRYFKELFEIKDSLSGSFYAVKSNTEVINFVSRNPEAMGIISMNWISDKDDPVSMELRNKINLVAVSKQYVNDGSYYRPEPGFIYNKSYPFIREVYLISRESFPGLGSGFINWACGEQGQRIVLKSGLVPATMPIRLVQIKKQ